MGGGSDVKNEQPKLARAQLQTASYGQPVAIVYGTTRVPANVIWLDDFTAERIEDSQHVGKGGGGNITSVRYRYWSCVMLALAEGPVAAIQRMWADKDRFDTPAKAGFETTLLGTRPQTPWAHLTGSHAAKAVGYGGTAIVAAAKLDMGESGSLKNHTAEVKGFLATAVHGYTDPVSGAARNDYDAAPSDLLPDLLTNNVYGFAWPAARLASLAVGSDGTAASSVRNWCHANGVYLSLAMKEQRSGLEWLRDLLLCCNSAAFLSGDVLKILPYGDVAASGNGYTYTPDNTVRYALGPDDFVDKKDPVRVTRTSLADAFNICPVEFLDRVQDYKPTPVESPEQADVDAFGERRADLKGLHMITRASVAQLVSRLMAQRNVWIRNTYTFKLPWRYVLLEPMDLVSLTEPKLGLPARVVRITKVREAPNGALTVEAEEWPFGVGTAPTYAPQTSDGLGRDWNVDPGNASAPVVFVPTLDTTGGALEVWLATSGGAAWGGAEVWVSDDDATYSRVGTARRARYGTCQTAINAAATSFDLDLSAGPGVMSTLSTAGRDDDVLPVWVNGEIISYLTASLVGTNRYTLASCVRGRRSTDAAAHAVGDPAVVLDDAVFRFPISYSRLGRTLYVKLVSMNANGGGQQDLATVPTYSVTLPAAPALYPVPAGVTVAVSTTEP